MTEHENSLNPEEIDKLTERSYAQLPQEEHRLVQGLYTLTQEYAEENERSLERTWRRLVQKQASADLPVAGQQNEPEGKLLSMKGKRMHTNNPYGEMKDTTIHSQGAKRSATGTHRSFRRMLGLSAAAAVVLVTILSWALIYSGLHSSKHGGLTNVGSAPQQTSATPTPSNGQVEPFCSFTDQNASATFTIDHSLSWSSKGELTTTAWNVDTYDTFTCQRVAFPTNIQASYAYWSPDGTRLLLIENSAQIVDKNGNVLVTHTVSPASVAVSPTGYVPLVSMSGNGNDSIESAWSPDGTRVASVYSLSIANNPSPNYGVEIWNATTGTHQLTLACPNNEAYGIRSLVWSPDGKYLAATAEEGAGICVWNASTGNRITTIPSNSGTVTFSADSKELAFTQGSSVVVASATSGQIIHTFTVQDPLKRLDSVAWSPDGKYLAAGGQNLHVLNASNGTALATYEQLNAGTDVAHLAWSPDSTMVASESYDIIDSTSEAFINAWKVA